MFAMLAMFAIIEFHRIHLVEVIFDPFVIFLIKRNENTNYEAFTALWNSNIVHYFFILPPAVGGAALSVLFCSWCLFHRPYQHICQRFAVGSPLLTRMFVPLPWFLEQWHTYKANQICLLCFFFFTLQAGYQFWLRKEMRLKTGQIEKKVCSALP